MISSREINASWPDRPCEVGLVEGAGGVASPLAADGDSASLAFRLPADVVVLVADPSLGVINLVRLCARALEPVPVVVHLNRYDQVDPPPFPQPGLARRPGRLDGHDLARAPAQPGPFDSSREGAHVSTIAHALDPGSHSGVHRARAFRLSLSGV